MRKEELHEVISVVKEYAHSEAGKAGYELSTRVLLKALGDEFAKEIERKCTHLIEE